MSPWSVVWMLFSIAGFTLGAYMQGREDAGDHPGVLHPAWMHTWGVMWMVLAIAS